MDSNVTEVAFNKKDPKFLTCMGPNFFKLYQLNEGQLSLVKANITGLISDSTRVIYSRVLQKKLIPKIRFLLHILGLMMEDAFFVPIKVKSFFSALKSNSSPS